ncbi:MAG: NAD(P)-dependent oxidoreductase [Muribaculum sp.]|nr:NAD(P)-dependent oxidoreductase [Muribaculum sp.]
MDKPIKVFVTGGTGLMGMATLARMCETPSKYCVRVLARPSKKNQKKLAPFVKKGNVEVAWGDLTDPGDVARALGDAMIVLHMGGMVSPAADAYPEATMRVNTSAAKNIVAAVKARPDADRIKVVYVGSVSQTSCRNDPYHWGRTGDPIMCAVGDFYGLSKILAERIFAESGLRRWVSLRQSGVLHAGLLMKATDPTAFHVPLRGVLEWTTLEDSARLMTAVCEDSVPESFWRKFYNVGSGAHFRFSNYEFECRLLKALKCPPPEKLFDPDWFTTRNFHGEWYMDSDRLEEILHFRENISSDEYFRRMTRTLPWYFSLAPIVPAAAMKAFMRSVAMKKDRGPLYWASHPECEEQIKVYFGNTDIRPGEKRKWKDTDVSRPSDEPRTISHGYDESKDPSLWDINDMRGAAEFRGGKCLSENMRTGDAHTPLEWECAFGHKFKSSPAMVLWGGHWCEHCLPSPWRYGAEARRNRYLAQIWYASHDPDEPDAAQ